MSRIEIEHMKSEPYTTCADCDALNRRATRERARQHAAAKGHYVRVVVDDITIYKPKAES
jgi:hypothetical protein